MRAARSLAKITPTLSMRALLPAATSLSIVARNSARRVLVIFFGSLSVNLSATAEINCWVETVFDIATPSAYAIDSASESTGSILANQVLKYRLASERFTSSNLG